MPALLLVLEKAVAEQRAGWEDIAEAIIEALGNLGDPGALSVLESLQRRKGNSPPSGAKDRNGTSYRGYNSRSTAAPCRLRSRSEIYPSSPCRRAGIGQALACCAPLNSRDP